MARPYPREFRDDVVRVARNRDNGVTIEQIATDFGIHPMTLTKWIRQADIDDGAKAPARAPAIPLNCASYDAEIGCWNKRMKSCGGRPRICRRPICREKALPARK